MVSVYLPLIIIAIDILYLLAIWYSVQIDILINVLLFDWYVMLKIDDVILVEEIVELVVHSFYDVLFYICC